MSLKEVRIRSDEGENGIEDMTKIRWGMPNHSGGLLPLFIIIHSG